MGRPSNTAERRAEIVAAMGVVIARDGYRGATISAIAKQAGLTPGLLHYHFPKKLDILLALVEEAAARVDTRARERLERASDDPLKQLLAYVDAHVALGPGADPTGVAAWVAIGAEAIREPEVQQVYQAAVAARMKELTRLFRACLRARSQSPSPAPRMAAAVAATIEGAYQLGTAAQGALPEGYASPTLARVVRGLVGE